jgi:thiol-disulfide isomerase/thioredoxin
MPHASSVRTIASPALSLLLLLSAALLAGVPAFGEALDQRGRPHDVRGPSASYTVVEFAAAWCKPCYKALPRLEALSKEHPGIRFLVVSVDEKIVEGFQPEEFPATYVLDRTGKVVHQHFGYSKAKLDALAAFLATVEAKGSE